MFAVNRAAEILVWFVGLDAPDLGMTSSQLPPLFMSPFSPVSTEVPPLIPIKTIQLGCH